MKIIIHDLAAHPFVFQLSKELAKRDIEVFHFFSTFFSSPNQGNLKPLKDNSNLILVPIDIEGTYSKTNFIKRRYADISYGKIVARKIRKIKPDVFINCVSQLDSSKIIQKTCLDEKVKYFTWLQDVYSVATKAVLTKKIPALGKLIGLYYESVEAKILRDSDQIIAITEDFIPLLGSWRVKLEKVNVIPNWAIIEDIPVGGKNNEWSIRNALKDKFCIFDSGKHPGSNIILLFYPN